MERHLPLITALASLLAALLVVLQRRPAVPFRPLEPGVIYDVDAATETPRSTPCAAADLPVFTVYTELRTPDRFIAEVVPGRARADFVLVNDALLARRTPPVVRDASPAAHPPPAVSPPRPAVPGRAAGKPPDPRAAASPPVHPPPPAPAAQQGAAAHVPATLTVREVRDIVRGSGMTYRYPDCVVGGDVRLRVVSRTPWHGGVIVAFRVDNPRPGYVFLSGVWVSDESGQPLDARVLAERFVAGESSMEGYIILPPGVRRAVLKAAEAGGSGAVLEVPFSP
jgi:hypothetical protein